MKVCKFGGSSVADAAQIRKVKSICEEDSSRSILIVSAPGKRNKTDEKITDLLYKCHSLAKQGKSIDVPFNLVKSRYLEIAKELQISTDLEPVIDEVGIRIKNYCTSDYAASRGEYLSAMLIADALGAKFIDAENVIRLTEDGRVHDNSYKLLAEYVKGEKIVVLPGFYGATLKGELKTFSRGGSDISGAIAARAVNAEVYENWTDVSGILIADPNVAENPKTIKQITYREIREMASIGASVFHEEAISPVKSMGIPINVKNTNDPSAPGTYIVADRDTDGALIVGVSGKKPYRQITVEKFMMNKSPQISAQIIEKLKNEGVDVEFEMKGFDTLSLYVVSGGRSKQELEPIFNKLVNEIQADGFSIGDEVAVIGVVGEGLKTDPGISTKVLTALKSSDIIIDAINYGGSPITMMIAVPS